MTNKIEALIADMKVAAQEEIMCRENCDTSDKWNDEASPENVLLLIAALEQAQQLNQRHANNERVRARELVIYELHSDGSSPQEVAEYMRQWDEKYQEENADFRENSNSSTEHFRENAEASTSNKPRLAPDKFGRCISSLVFTAKQYIHAGNLRARMVAELSKYVEPDHPHTRKTCKLCGAPEQFTPRIADKYCDECGAPIDLDDNERGAQ